MPQTTPERAARWPGQDREAIEFLKSQGFTLRRDWYWDPPKGRLDFTAREFDAIEYLVEEWDFGGLVIPYRDKEP